MFISLPGRGLGVNFEEINYILGNKLYFPVSSLKKKVVIKAAWNCHQNSSINE
jgi:hypothetical protein